MTCISVSHVLLLHHIHTRINQSQSDTAINCFVIGVPSRVVEVEEAVVSSTYFHYMATGVDAELMNYFLNKISTHVYKLINE